MPPKGKPGPTLLMLHSKKLHHWLTICRQYRERAELELERRFPVFYARFPDFWRLARMDRPIGIFLLLWPTLWCLWIAADGWPDLKLLVIFIVATTCMRAAGCCINDYADRNFDGHVRRTRERPLPMGRVTPREALTLCAVLCLVAFLLVLLTNPLTVYMSFGAVALALLYPFTKRYTHLAQVFLGAAFSWGGLMAFTAQTGTLPVYAWLLYVANLLWTVAYDTEYAMVDREDDLRIGVKSTAILLGEADRFFIGMLQILFLVAMWLAAGPFELGRWYLFGLQVAAALFIYQHFLTRNREPGNCFKAFLNNHYVGLAIFTFTVVDLW